MSETTQASGFFRLAVMSFADSRHLAAPNTLIEKLARLPLDHPALIADGGGET
jgi:hypothetical protein